MKTIRIQPDPFDPGHELAHLLAASPAIGGLGCFIGTVRSTAENPIRALNLEHYPGMTERALERIAHDANARWPILGTTIIHRIGRLAPGDPIVLVATTSAHRQAALDSTAFLIDWLKTAAPFWKSEQALNGTTSWVDARETDTHATTRWNQESPNLLSPD